ncbi:histidine utilization protein HutD [Rhodanobacter sp. B05]|uniref:HutD/Ves family protein n=1 Tax=Rhodanobacter sp. B05 TaxID=1945859 RepID=UPI0009868C35|nr:HutD family protein [Rhodanobacter sp. B05]OOG57049.1 histidine utilization protein HutD [Rhodanobacter sp. B05]
MIIRLADCPSQPWKNGLGRTREIAVHPAAAGSDDLVWRVSIAEVDSAAPFSVFTGIDRQIALLDGDGFTMTLDGRQVHALTTPFAPFAFPGEASVEVTLAGDPTRDFNLMVRRAQARGDVQTWHGSATRTPDPATVLIFCARGMIDTVDGHLHAGDAWRPTTRMPDPVTLHDDALALVVRIEPCTI